MSKTFKVNYKISKKTIIIEKSGITQNEKYMFKLNKYIIIL